MGNVRSLMDRSSREIRECFRRYPVTILLVAAVTVLEAAILDMKNQPMLERGVLPFLFWLVIGMFFAESYWYQRNIKISRKGILCFFLILVSLRIASGNYFYGKRELQTGFWLTRLEMVYLSLMLLGAVYFCYRRSKDGFAEYVLKVFANIIRIHIVYLALLIGVGLISAIIYTLFIRGYSFSLLERLVILVTGLYYVPSWLFALTETESEAERFAKIVVKGIVFPLALIVYVIIYVYILKILVYQDIPSNQIYLIVTVAFLLGVAAWTMMEAVEGHGGRNELDDEREKQEKHQEPLKMARIAERLPWLFIPLIFLQIYSVGIRIWQFGVTPQRYFGIIWLVVETIYLCLYFRGAEKMQKIFPVCIVISGIIWAMPGVNAYDMSFYSQIHNLELVRAKDDLNTAEKEKVSGAYRYLTEAVGGESYLKENYTTGQLEKMEKIAGENKTGDVAAGETVLIYTEYMNQNLDIRGYSSLQRVTCDLSGAEETEDLMQIKLTENSSGSVIGVVNLENFISQCVEVGIHNLKDEDGEATTEITAFAAEQSRIAIDDNTLFVIDTVSMEVEKNTKQVQAIYIEGYWMTK